MRERIVIRLSGKLRREHVLPSEPGTVITADHDEFPAELLKKSGDDNAVPIASGTLKWTPFRDDGAVTFGPMTVSIAGFAGGGGPSDLRLDLRPTIVTPGQWQQIVSDVARFSSPLLVRSRLAEPPSHGVAQPRVVPAQGGAYAASIAHADLLHDSDWNHLVRALRRITVTPLTRFRPSSGDGALGLSRDTAENRLVAEILTHIDRELTRVHEHLSRTRTETSAEHAQVSGSSPGQAALRAELATKLSRVDALLDTVAHRRGWLRRYARIVASWLPREARGRPAPVTTRILRKEAYTELMRWRRPHGYLAPGGASEPPPHLSISSRDASRVFEIWAWMALVEMLKALGYRESEGRSLGEMLLRDDLYEVTIRSNAAFTFRRPPQGGDLPDEIVVWIEPTTHQTRSADADAPARGFQARDRRTPDFALLLRTGTVERLVIGDIIFSSRDADILMKASKVARYSAEIEYVADDRVLRPAPGGIVIFASPLTSPSEQAAQRARLTAACGSVDPPQLLGLAPSANARRGRAVSIDSVADDGMRRVLGALLRPEPAATEERWCRAVGRILLGEDIRQVATELDVEPVALRDRVDRARAAVAGPDTRPPP